MQNLLKNRELDGQLALKQGWHIGEFQHWIDSDNNYYFEPPHYTTSLDDAITLIPEGWFYSISTKSWTSDVAVLLHKGFANKSRIWASAATPALAMCICALKANIAG